MHASTTPLLIATLGLLSALSLHGGCVGGDISENGGDGGPDRSLTFLDGSHGDGVVTPPLDSSVDASPTQWVHHWSKIQGSPLSDGAWHVAAAPNGNIVVTGYFSGTTSFGGRVLASRGSSDIFVASYDPNGNHLWSKSFGGVGSDEAYALSIDSAGSIAVAGRFSSTATFDATALTSDAASDDAFLLRLSASGEVDWVKRFGGVGDDAAWVVAHAGNDIYVGGRHTAAIDFGVGAHQAVGEGDAFIARVDSNGVGKWSKSYGAGGHDVVRAIAVDPQNNMFFAAQFLDTVTIESTTHTSAGAADVLLASYDHNGTLRWSKRIGGLGTEVARGLTSDDDGNVTLIGKFEQTVTVGGATLVSKGEADILLVSYAASGLLRWARGIGGATADVGRSVVALDDGSIAYTARFTGSVGFSSGVASSKGLDDIVVERLSNTGTPVWSAVYGGVGIDYSNSIAATADHVYVVGSCASDMDFGDGPLKGQGGTDAFILAYRR